MSDTRFDSDTAALAWVFEQQRTRRNLSKGAQALFWLRMLERSGQPWAQHPEDGRT
jgi:hypothetical protein